MTLIEIMVVVMIIGMIASAVGVNVMGSMVEARKKVARTDATTLTSIAEGYMAAHPSESCPSVSDLREANLYRGNDLDPWEKAYAIDCDEDAIRARSAGPNGTFDDEDDIVSDR